MTLTPNINRMQKEYTIKDHALELINKAREATTYQYQEYAGAHYSTFEHDLDTLKEIALMTIRQMITVSPKHDRFYYELVKTELEALK